MRGNLNAPGDLDWQFGRRMLLVKAIQRVLLNGVLLLLMESQIRLGLLAGGLMAFVACDLHLAGEVVD